MTDALEQARALFLEGNTHFEAGRLEDALERYRAALSLAPGRPSILANLGITQVRLWLNDVGAEPRRFGVSVAAFHQTNSQRSRHVPHGLLATSTHDSKRSEDTRARLNVLSEMPAEWEDAVLELDSIGERFVSPLDGPAAALLLSASLGLPALPLLAGGGALGLLLGLINHLALRPLERLATQARQQADNPLSQWLYTGRRDAFGAIAFALQSLQAEAGAVVGRIADSARQLSGEAGQLATAVEHHNNATLQQRQETEQVASAMGQMTVSVQEVARNAQLSASAASASRVDLCSPTNATAAP